MCYCCVKRGMWQECNNVTEPSAAVASFLYRVPCNCFILCAIISFLSFSGHLCVCVFVVGLVQLSVDYISTHL